MRIISSMQKSQNYFGAEILCSITKPDFCQIPGHSIITDKRMVSIALIMKVKGSAFLSVVCIKKCGIQIQKNNSLWHLNTVNFFQGILLIVRNRFKVSSAVRLKNLGIVGCDARDSFSITDLNIGSLVSSLEASSSKYPGNNHIYHLEQVFMIRMIYE